MSWRLGASTGCCVDVPILPVLDAIAESGLASVELGTPPRHFDPWSAEEIRAVHERLDRLRLHALSIHAPFGWPLDLSDADPRNRAGAVDAILTAAAALKQVGGSIVVVHPSDVERRAQDVEARLANSAASLGVLARACERMSLTLAIETPLPHLVGGHPDEFEWLLRHVEPNVGVCLDTAHTTLGGHWQRFVEIAARRLVHVHASDHHGGFDEHLAPGDGIIDWRAIGDGLRGLDFDGCVMLELACPGTPLADHFARARAKAERVLG